MAFELKSHNVHFPRFSEKNLADDIICQLPPLFFVSILFINDGIVNAVYLFVLFLKIW